MICASPLIPTPPSKSRVALPPQNILDGLEGRMIRAVKISPTVAPQWAWWTTALVLVAIIVSVYLLYFVDTYQVEAINYSPSAYDQTGTTNPDL
ncbi:hypothetical protein A2994_03530 [candidate division Kazan bacterium RIFCSPLOWO2_01_FULL_48_13]|uniref:Uncharacterized protein n=1 Tax=candidate division Kazan bacterium RIFCSPLOWO2_01_FULL_48_13 TaxID=1798539 RepID=A0A1F4PNH4_UNCK3|nr:MAG: hypothetical protein A2994_03530 [candidate division Kazan bacterium RIFCSPLOWO2_01_FULL_48_13]